MKRLTLLILLIAMPVEAQEVLSDFDKQNLPVLNEELRAMRRDIRKGSRETNLSTGVEGVLSLANGGTDTALTDPNADRIFFWDEGTGTTGDTAFLTPNNYLDISGTNLNVDATEIAEDIADLIIADYEDGTTYVEASNDTERTESAGDTTYTKVKEFSPIIRHGNVTVTWEHKSGAGTTTVGTKLYKNGVALGSAHTTTNTSYEVVTESNIAVTPGDVLQVYWNRDGADAKFVKNFRIKTLNPTTPQAVSGF